MARRIRDAILESRAAREKLKPRGKPYYRSIGQGLHLGYRKGKTAGRWVVRLYVGEQNYRVETIADADDRLDANGNTILDFWQAQEKARELRVDAEPTPEPEAALTVGDAVKAYIEKRDARDTRRAGRVIRSDASRRLTRYVLGQKARGKNKAVPAARLASVALPALTEADLRAWRTGLPETLKTTTVARLVNDAKAALNAAYEMHRAELPPALPEIVRHGLRAIEHDDEGGDPVARENQILTGAEVGRLLVAAREVDTEQNFEGDLFRLVVVLAATGARFSQIARMRVADCQIAAGRLMVPVSRKGKGKSGSTPVPVGPDVIDALRPAVIGRTNDAPLLERWRHRQIPGAIRWERADRGAWQSASELLRPWAAIRERAELPDAIPYALRHSSIVRGIKANLPIRLIAATHDTSVVMIERHYARWITSGLEELTRAAIVPLVPAVTGDNIRPMRGGTR